MVLDASAVMRFFLGQPGAEKVKEILALAAEGKRVLSMSVVNWGEIYYALWRDRGQDKAQATMARIAQLPIEIVPADREQARLAAEFKVKCRLPYAAGFAAALARLRKAELVASDADFSLLKQDNVLIFFG